jgi:hypothetical protein
MTDFEKYKETDISILRILTKIDERIDSVYSDEIKNKLLEFKSYLDSSPQEKIKPNPDIIQGDYFNFDKIKNEIAEITGYLWKVEDITGSEIYNEMYNTEEIEHTYNIYIKQEYIKVYEFSRNSNSRNELYLLRLVLMPGCGYIEWDTPRAGGVTNLCKTEKELLIEFSKV